MDAKLARAVQDEVVKRRGGKPPSYQHCLTLVRNALRTVPCTGDREEWKADIVASIAKVTS